MKLKIDKPQYPKNRDPWRARLIDKDVMGEYTIHVGMYRTWAEALFRGKFAFKFLVNNSNKLRELD